MSNDESNPEKQTERIKQLREMLSELPGLPEFARGPTRRKIERKAHKWGISLADFAAATSKVDEEDLPGAEKKKESGFAARLLSLSEFVRDSFGRPAYRIPIAMTGQWVKGEPFSITAADLDMIITNFEKRGNAEVVVDYDHASERPDIAQGNAVPAAGWLTAPTREQLDGIEVLTALYAPTDKAKDLIDRKEYRYVSPAIDWGFPDKKTGKPQGATLTSTALTNHPFLDQLPALQLRDIYRSQAAVLMTDLQGGKVMTTTAQIAQMKVRATELKTAGKSAEAATLLAEIEKLEGAALSMDDKPPRLKLRKMADGPRKGQFGLFTFDGNSPVGYVAADDMPKSEEGDADADDKKKMAEAIAEFKSMGLASLNMTEIRSLVEKGRAAATKEAGDDGKKILMTEAVQEGVFDRAKATFVANEHRSITIKDYAAVERADSILASAVATGKLAPTHRKELFADVVNDPEKWQKLFKSAVPLFNVGAGVGAPGATDGGDAGVEERVNAQTKQFMTEKKIEDYATAMRGMLAENPALRAEYEAARGKKA